MLIRSAAQRSVVAGGPGQRAEQLAEVAGAPFGSQFQC
jgi:hypothetical protein